MVLWNCILQIYNSILTRIIINIDTSNRTFQWVDSSHILNTSHKNNEIIQTIYFLKTYFNELFDEKAKDLSFKELLEKYIMNYVNFQEIDHLPLKDHTTKVKVREDLIQLSILIENALILDKDCQCRLLPKDVPMFKEINESIGPKLPSKVYVYLFGGLLMPKVN